MNFEGGELQALYDRLNSEFEDSKAAAERIRERISKVEGVAEALFEEWEEELGLYTNASLRRNSQRQLNETEQQYNRLIVTMKRVGKSMDPVPNTFRDQVLYQGYCLSER